MRIIVICIISWFIAQLIKFIINLVKYYSAKSKDKEYNKITVETLFKLGGMPSSHTATVIALASSVGMHSGWDSDAFAVAGVFAFIVMFDAIKVRLPISLLTDAFNSLQDVVYGKDVTDVKKVEGHTLPEIAGGVVVGSSVAFIMVRVFEFLA